LGFRFKVAPGAIERRRAPVRSDAVGLAVQPRFARKAVDGALHVGFRARLARAVLELIEPAEPCLDGLREALLERGLRLAELGKAFGVVGFRCGSGQVRVGLRQDRRLQLHRLAVALAGAALEVRLAQAGRLPDQECDDREREQPLQQLRRQQPRFFHRQIRSCMPVFSSENGLE
jgi:hypothetical protein